VFATLQPEDGVRLKPDPGRAGNVVFGTNPASMGVTNAVLADTASSLQAFVNVFVGIYVLLIFLWVLLSWVRLPYSRTSAAVQEFLNEVVRPYVRLFRRLPTLGPLDLSPIVAVIVLLVAAGFVNALIGAVL
jgi:YggT family protein